MTDRMEDPPHAPPRALEHGYQATAALRHLRGRALAAVRARATFLPVADDELAPVLPCAECGDGGLRVVGRVRGRRGWQRVHACDTCGTVHHFDLPPAT